jgi:hypothetical protein
MKMMMKRANLQNTRAIVSGRLSTEFQLTKRNLRCLVHLSCILLCPLLANSLCILLILFVMFRDVRRKRIVRIWGAQEGLNR